MFSFTEVYWFSNFCFRNSRKCFNKFILMNEVSVRDTPDFVTNRPFRLVTQLKYVKETPA